MFCPPGPASSPPINPPPLPLDPPPPPVPPLPAALPECEKLLLSLAPEHPAAERKKPTKPAAPSAPASCDDFMRRAYSTLSDLSRPRARVQGAGVVAGEVVEVASHPSLSMSTVESSSSSAASQIA